MGDFMSPRLTDQLFFNQKMHLVHRVLLCVRRGGLESKELKAFPLPFVLEIMMSSSMFSNVLLASFATS